MSAEKLLGANTFIEVDDSFFERVLIDFVWIVSRIFFVAPTVRDIFERLHKFDHLLFLVMQNSQA